MVAWHVSVQGYALSLCSKIECVRGVLGVCWGCVEGVCGCIVTATCLLHYSLTPSLLT